MCLEIWGKICEIHPTILVVVRGAYGAFQDIG